MLAEAKTLGTLYRAQRRVVDIDCDEDLVDFVSVTVRSLYPNLLRFEFYVSDRSGKLTASRVHGDSARKLIELPDLQRVRKGNAANDPAPAPSGPSPRSRLSAPILDGRRAAGLIVIEASPASPFTDLDLEMLEAATGLFSLALERLHSQQVEFRRASIEHDLRTAGGMQRRLMARTLPVESGIRVDARYLPALHVGGDFYDLAYLGQGRVGGAIGDVSGKGVTAALQMSSVASDLGRALRAGFGPSKVLESLNTTLLDTDSETFVTASCISLDAPSRTLTVANAGHLPLLVRRAGGEVIDFGSASGTPLGMIPGRYADERIELRPLDIVLLMTDGLAEALDCPEDRTGILCVKRLVSAAPHDARAINDSILAAANARKGTRLDDMTLVGLQLGPR